MHIESKSNADARKLRIGIAVSRYHHEITDSMLRGAVDAFTRAGGDPSRLVTAHSPGAYELVAVCRAMSLFENDDGESMIDGIVALGCIITGETTHDQYLAAAVAQGLVNITVNCGVPIAFGVLTCQTMDQARVRAGLAPPPPGGKPAMNKGAEAMIAAIEAANAVQSLHLVERSRR
jgi:6,7-dimethyl-8-ribityllumazine synthase